jgi:hypothetical protein
MSNHTTILELDRWDFGKIWEVIWIFVIYIIWIPEIQITSQIFPSFPYILYIIVYITDSQRTDPEYLNDTNVAGYLQAIKTLNCRKSRFHSSDLDKINQSNPQISYISYKVKKKQFNKPLTLYVYYLFEGALVAVNDSGMKFPKLSLKKILKILTQISL